MFANTRLDDRFLDRPGCGDEIYLDSRFRASEWLAGLQGSALDLGSDLDLDFTDEDGDESTSH